MSVSSNIRMVQALRAAACLLVVAYHALIFRPGAVHAWPSGATGVDLFFVISGYVMIVSSRRLIGQPAGWRCFLTRRFQRIVPLYWLLTCVKYGLYYLLPGLTPHTRPTAWNLAASFLFIPAYDRVGSIRPVLPVGWTLNYEMLFYALFAGSLAVRINPLWTTPVLAALTAAGFWQNAAWPAPFSLANGMVLEFAAGMVIGGTSWAVPVRAAPWIITAAGILLLTLPPAGHWRFLEWGMPAAAMLAAALALESSVGPRLPNAVCAIGDASYAIYLVHPFVVPSLARHGEIPAIASIPVSVTAGLLLHWLVDAPLQRRLSEKRRSAPDYGAEGEVVLLG
jgi:peptidoglycan/LPS O-acetylase OafA/YrhL